MKIYLATLLSLLSSLAPTSAAPSIATNDLLRLGLTPPEAILRHFDELQLPEEQKKKLTEVYEAAKMQSESLEADIAKQRALLEAAVSNAASTVEESEAALNALLEAEAAVKRLQLRTIVGMNQILDATQRSQAIALAKRDAELQPVIEGKIAKIKSAIAALGFEPSQAIQERGQAIEHLLANGQTEAANQALDAAISDLGLDEDPAAIGKIDFTSFEPGDTDPGSLERRFHAVDRQVQSVLKLATLRQFMQAHDALEAAKQAEDAMAAGRVLTWAETIFE
jgi:hypothetical protein